VPLHALKYTMRTNAEGQVVGSLTILKLAEERYLLMCYAVTSRVDLPYIMEHLPQGASLRDVTWDHSLLMITGPQTDAVLQSLVPSEAAERISALPNFMATPIQVRGQTAMVSRVSYCGGLGYEIHVPKTNGAATELYERLRTSSAAQVTEIGYTATNVMRTEAGRPFFSVDIPTGARYPDCVPKFLARSTNRIS